MKQKSNFIYYTGIIAIIFVVLAFGIAAMVQPHRIERYFKPFVIIHIILSMGWLILFIYQSQLAQKGQLNKHRKNVNIATALVVSSTIIAVYITYAWGDARRLIGESRDILAFAILFFASIWAIKRGKPETHKRLVLIALMNLIGPAFTRVWFIFAWPQETIVFALLFTWIIIPVFYDLVTIRRIHKATYIGVGFTLLSFVIMIAIVFSPLLQSITEFLYELN
ncbi:hypothetical protein [Yeosuana marina]|uniref:hypothetical protein n=1 Tax=Yeosuana marina TaxID=1565536 RepID=UPI0030C7EAF0